MAALPRPCLVESILFTSRPQTTFFSAPGRRRPARAAGRGGRHPRATAHALSFRFRVGNQGRAHSSKVQLDVRNSGFGRASPRAAPRAPDASAFSHTRTSQPASASRLALMPHLTHTQPDHVYFYRTFLLYAHETNVRSSQYSEAWFEAREFTSSRAHLYMSCKAARTWRPGCVARRAERRQHARPEAGGRRAGGRGGQKCSTRAQIPGAAPGSAPVQLVLGLLLGLRARPVQQRDHHQEGCELQEVGAVLDGRNRAKTATP